LKKFDEDEGVGAIVLTGSEKAFAGMFLVAVFIEDSVLATTSHGKDYSMNQ